jgi:microcin C transport system substrate-binding protein
MSWKFSAPFAVLTLAMNFAFAAGGGLKTNTWLEAAALGGTPKYQAGFKHFEYANPSAPKGGTIRFGVTVPFDTLNPYTLKGLGFSYAGDHVFETLFVNSDDEPFAMYGLLAESLKVDKDEMGVSFKLRSEAKFSDGTPVTAEDVVWTFEKITSKEGSPQRQAYYADVASAKAVDAKTVYFKFKKKNNELPMILGQVAVLPKAFYSKGNFTSDFSQKAMGSGPYTVKKFEPGKIIELTKNANYWGAQLPVNVGRFNYEQMVFKIYRDSTIWLEAFKAGEFDFASVNSAKQWATDVAGDKWNKGLILKTKWPHQNTQGMQGFAMNTRKSLFASRKTRQALAIAMDFDWMNKTLFFDQYEAAESYYGNGDLQAKGLPSPAELKLLEPFKAQIPAEVFTEAPAALGKGWDARKRLVEAKRLLDEDGWKMEGGVLKKNGEAFKFTILLDDTFWQRIVEPYTKALKNLGIETQIQMVDSSVFQKKIEDFDFDMIVQVYGQSQSPGNEQRGFFGSKAAGQKGSDNLIGLKDPAVDAIIEKLVAAKTREDLVTATRALDRVLWFGYYLVPHWGITYHRVTMWKDFQVPSTLPKYFTPMPYFMQFSWNQTAAATKK